MFYFVILSQNLPVHQRQPQPQDRDVIWQLCRKKQENPGVACGLRAELGQMWWTKTDKGTTGAAALGSKCDGYGEAAGAVWWHQSDSEEFLSKCQCVRRVVSRWVKLSHRSTYFPFPSSCKLLELLHVDSRLLPAQSLLSVFWLISQTQQVYRQEKKTKNKIQIILGEINVVQNQL